MGVYRVEASPNKRAGCINKECKDKGTKILKGEFRFAVQVTIKDHQSWQYKHWGCVTPKQIENLIESSGGDTDMVDGYDELPDEYKEKVDYALENHHVHDDDWNGDLEANRDGRSGMRLTKAELKKKAKEAGDDADGEEKPKKKRGKKAKADDDEDDEEEAPAPKKKSTRAIKKESSDDENAPATKKRGRPAKKTDHDEDEAPAPKKARATRGKKVEYKEEDDEDEEPPRKKKNKAKARPKKASMDSEDDAELEEEPEADNDTVDEEGETEEVPKPKHGKKAASNGAAKAPLKRGRKKVGASDE